MSTRLFVNLSQIYLPLWLQDNLGLGATSVATTPLALYVSGFLASLLIGPLTQIAGRKVKNKCITEDANDVFLIDDVLDCDEIRT